MFLFMLLGWRSGFVGHSGGSRLTPIVHHCPCWGGYGWPIFSCPFVLACSPLTVKSVPNNLRTNCLPAYRVKSRSCRISSLCRNRTDTSIFTVNSVPGRGIGVRNLIKRPCICYSSYFLGLECYYHRHLTIWYGIISSSLDFGNVGSTERISAVLAFHLSEN